ncbi:hypothetical protein CGG86_22540 [Vibrio parahaemolyticus]|nr:hypothetical protein CGI96_23580 [Vibrio parahaemolyticus]TOQ87314.1 hypothetical protein CGG86_22540 [Vibrio parahaemolyticus]TOR25025.1 hypothetical protein CGG77_24365 [Vibrio parahaemolyticus]
MFFERLKALICQCFFCAPNYITKRLRGILNAWHFQFDSALVSTAQWFRLGGSVVHPLTRRYVP